MAKLYPAGMASSTEEREAAQRTIAALRATRMRRRRHIPQGLRDAGEEVSVGLLELLAFLTLLVIASGVAAAVHWSWARSPILTVLSVAAVISAEALGLAKAVQAGCGHRRTDRLAILAIGIALVVGWGTGTWAFFGGWW